MEPNGENNPNSALMRKQVNTKSEEMIANKVFFKTALKKAPIAAMITIVTTNEKAAFIGRFSFVKIRIQIKGIAVTVNTDAIKRNINTLES